MTPYEARQIADHINDPAERLVDMWLAEVKHPEVGFVLLADVCCKLLERIGDDDRDRFGFALMDDLHHAMGHIYDADADGYDPWQGPVQ